MTYNVKVSHLKYLSLCIDIAYLSKKKQEPPVGDKARRWEFISEKGLEQTNIWPIIWPIL